MTSRHTSSNKKEKAVRGNDKVSLRNVHKRSNGLRPVNNARKRKNAIPKPLEPAAGATEIKHHHATADSALRKTLSRCRVLALGIDARRFAVTERIAALQDWLVVTDGYKPIDDVRQLREGRPSAQELVNQVQHLHGGKANGLFTRRLENSLVEMNEQLVAMEAQQAVAEKLAAARGYERLK